MKVRVTDDAKADLRQIKAFISARSVTAAEGVIDRIRKTLTLLAVLPGWDIQDWCTALLKRGCARAVPYRLSI